MASLTPPSKPLASMRRINPYVSIYEPPSPPPSEPQSPASAQPPSHPRLILLLSWFAARPVHIEKYIAPYKTLFPNTRILLIQCPVSVLCTPPFIVNYHFRPAVQILQSLSSEPTAGNNAHQLLVHVFSNGGISTLSRLQNHLRDSSTGETTFPRHTLICDSCPGYFHYQRTHAALLQPLPSWTSPLIHIAMSLSWIIFRILGKDSPLDVQARRLNSKAFVALQNRRLYLYGTGDEMVDWRDVEHHAAQAEEVGVVVRKEVFQAGKHVAHVRIDADRYWQAVREIWQGDTT